jgi:hypothetical protein
MIIDGAMLIIILIRDSKLCRIFLNFTTNVEGVTILETPRKHHLIS